MYLQPQMALYSDNFMLEKHSLYINNFCFPNKLKEAQGDCYQCFLFIISVTYELCLTKIYVVNVERNIPCHGKEVQKYEKSEA